MLTERWFLSTFALLALSCAGHANPIGVFNTGVNSSGVPLADGTLGDTHYLLTSVPAGSTTSIRVRTSAGGFPIGPWVGDDSISAWIGPNNDAQLDGPVGSYDYRTTFDLTGLNPATASLTGQWSVDNEGLDILINGVSKGITAGGFSAFTGLSISSGFVAGVNTLDFIVNNDGGPTGLRVEISGTAEASAAPEPASFVLIGAGLLALSRLRRRVRA